MHEIIDKKFYLGPKFGTLFNKKWITISELLQRACSAQTCIGGDCHDQKKRQVREQPPQRNWG
jgi:hypothetical protein